MRGVNGLRTYITLSKSVNITLSISNLIQAGRDFKALAGMTTVATVTSDYTPKSNIRRANGPGYSSIFCRCCHKVGTNTRLGREVGAGAECSNTPRGFRSDLDEGPARRTKPVRLGVLFKRRPQRIRPMDQVGARAGPAARAACPCSRRSPIAHPGGAPPTNGRRRGLFAGALLAPSPALNRVEGSL
jgi:hypothetical protein